jgi:hypothetical protein
MKPSQRTTLLGCVVLSVSLFVVSCAGASTPSRHATNEQAARVSPRATAPCSAALLFQAAVRKEHFNVSDLPSGPRVSVGKCYAGWAVAAISRPNVGMTDGDMLFMSRGDTWFEVEMLANGPVECWLEALHISAAVSAVLANGYKGSAEAGCTTPLHGLATERSDLDFSHLLAHLPYTTISWSISAENSATKQVVLVVPILLSQVDLSDRSAAIANYKRQVAAYMETYGVNPDDYHVQYTIGGA